MSPPIYLTSHPHTGISVKKKCDISYATQYFSCSVTIKGGCCYASAAPSPCIDPTSAATLAGGKIK